MFPILLAAFALGSAGLAFAEPKDEHGKMSDDDVRAFLSGQEPGSLAQPIALDAESKVESLCNDLMVSRGRATQELRAKKKAAERKIYRVRVETKGFKLGEYQADDKMLPLSLDQSLVALDGALSLAILDRDSGEFELSAQAAQGVLSTAEKKRLALEIVFRVDREHDGLPACYSYQKSGAYALRIEPLTLTLIDTSAQKQVASKTTDAMDDLKSWLEPGKAMLNVLVHDVEGPIDGEALTTAINKRSADLQSCLSAVMKSPSATAVLAYAATVTTGGAITELRREVEAAEQSGAASCVEKVIASVSAAKMPRVSRVHVTVSVDREEPERPNQD
jgi:hypothetical protein